MSSLNGIDDPSRLADTVAAHLAVKIAQKQEIQIVDTQDRLKRSFRIEEELDLLQVEHPWRVKGK